MGRGGGQIRKKGPNERREGKGGMEKKKGSFGEGRGYRERKGPTSFISAIIKDMIVLIYELIISAHA